MPFDKIAIIIICWLSQWHPHTFVKRTRTIRLPCTHTWKDIAYGYCGPGVIRNKSFISCVLHYEFSRKTPFRRALYFCSLARHISRGRFFHHAVSRLRSMPRRTSAGLPVKQGLGACLAKRSRDQTETLYTTKWRQ